jgi:hypothetical protein
MDARTALGGAAVNDITIDEERDEAERCAPLRERIGEYACDLCGAPSWVPGFCSACRRAEVDEGRA